MADYKKQINTDITFEDTSSNTPSSFYWDFGDGTTPTTVTTKTVTHKYTTVGTYNITHKSINSCGTGDCTIQTIEIITEAPSEFGMGTVVVIGVGLGLLYTYLKKK